MNISKYIIENYYLIEKVNGYNLERKWKNEITYIKNNLNLLKNNVEKCIKIITSISYNLDGKVLKTKNAQYDCINYMFDVFKNRYKPNKISLYFDYNKCEIEENYYCYGMAPIYFDMYYEQNKQQIKNFFESHKLQKRILYNNKISSNKTISLEDFQEIFSD